MLQMMGTKDIHLHPLQGQLIHAIGSRGSGAGQFDGPSAVDISPSLMGKCTSLTATTIISKYSVQTVYSEESSVKVNSNLLVTYSSLLMVMC